MTTATPDTALCGPVAAARGARRVPVAPKRHRRTQPPRPVRLACVAWTASGWALLLDGRSLGALALLTCASALSALCAEPKEARRG